MSGTRIITSITRWKVGQGVLGIAIVILLVIILWKVPEYQVGRDYAHDLVEAKDIPLLINEYRKTLIQIIGGLVVFFGLWLTWRRIVATEQTVEMSQEGQITERFTKAIEQLGNGDMTIRLGGIYALERIAKDSEKDHWTVMEVLSSFVREKAPLPEQAGTYEEAPDDADELEPSAGIPTEIQAILTVIGRRKAEREGKDQRLDLKRTWLQGANLQGVNLESADLLETVFHEADLQKVNLRGANLFRASFKKSQLQNGILEGAVLQEANLVEANLKGAILRKADLQGAYLKDAYIERADIREADLKRANLQGAILWEADLRGANLQGAILDRAELNSARLEGANLRGVSFKKVNLEGFNLQKFNLRGANLEGANLEGANLGEADLRDADLRKSKLKGVNLQGAKLEGAKLEGATGIPANLERTNFEGATGIPETWLLQSSSEAEHDQPGKDSLNTGEEDSPDSPVPPDESSSTEGDR